MAMPLNLQDKKAIVADLSAVMADAVSTVVADYRGLTVSQLTDLRSKARDSGLIVRIVRNTLVRRAVADTDFACLDKALVGPNILVISQDAPGTGARLLKDFMKDHDALEVRALAIGSDYYTADNLNAIAALPTYDEALAQLMSVMNAPVTKFVRTTNDIATRMVRVLSQVADQKKADES
jgi:large subunit ribosomal protein L10